MSSTLTPTCPLCGLRFPGRSLLDLHMREDHLERNRPAEPERDNSGDTGTPGDGAGGPSRDDGLASGLRAAPSVLAGPNRWSTRMRMVPSTSRISTTWRALS